MKENPVPQYMISPVAAGWSCLRRRADTATVGGRGSIATLTRRETYYLSTPTINVEADPLVQGSKQRKQGSTEVVAHVRILSSTS